MTEWIYFAVGFVCGFIVFLPLALWVVIKLGECIPRFR